MDLVYQKLSELMSEVSYPEEDDEEAAAANESGNIPCLDFSRFDDAEAR